MDPSASCYLIYVNITDNKYSHINYLELKHQGLTSNGYLGGKQTRKRLDNWYMPQHQISNGTKVNQLASDATGISKTVPELQNSHNDYFFKRGYKRELINYDSTTELIQIYITQEIKIILKLKSSQFEEHSKNILSFKGR